MEKKVLDTPKFNDKPTTTATMPQEPVSVSGLTNASYAYVCKVVNIFRLIFHHVANTWHIRLNCLGCIRVDWKSRGF